MSWIDEELFVRFKWARGYPNRKVDPDKVGAELQAHCCDDDGEIQLERIVKRAKRKTSAMHPLFEWDDKAAAEAHRMQQARKLHGSLVVVYRNPETDEEAEVRATTVVKRNSNTAQWSNAVAKSPDLTQMRRGILLREIEALLDRYDQYAAYDDVVDRALTLVRESLEELRASV